LNCNHCAVFRYFAELREIQLSETDGKGYIASFVKDDGLKTTPHGRGVFLCAEPGGGWWSFAPQPGDQTPQVTRHSLPARALQPASQITGQGPRGMNDRESPEKRTVERTDELLKKSRRLIDELEFILENLQEDPQRANAESRQKDSSAGGARGS
jgi:hypothetical protein